MSQGGSINQSTEPQPTLRVFDRKPEPDDVRAEVLAGLSATPKRLHPKFFYDEAGSKLFEAITRLPEYYLTRTELGIFDAHLHDLAAAVPAGACLVEYGSGSSLKIRRMLSAMAPAAYVPVDISGDHLLEMARSLSRDYPDLAIYPTCADFTSRFELPPPVADLRKVGFFPGSSIGNFTPRDAAAFLSTVAATLGRSARLIIGVDLVKDAAILEAAYDDAAGVTAAFNRNLLKHLGTVLNADLHADIFQHRAIYNDTLGAVQMFLLARQAHEVVIDGQTIRFEAGEAIHTENSFKYQPDNFLALARSAGFEQVERWLDDRGWFAVYLLEVSRQGGVSG